MAWATLDFEQQEVNAAGRDLARMAFPVVDDEAIKALSIINNWRSAHAYPLNTFQITLRTRARRLEKDVIVAQRIKRLESIHAKLSRQQTMRMTQMQDIAGCRAVLKRMTTVRRLVAIYKSSGFAHRLKGEKDYIAAPKPDGYRCHHLVYIYQGTLATAAYSGLQVEVQIRTQMQHAWATAVEAVGIFTRQALKSNQGDRDWLRFFALMSSAIAAIERCNPVPGTPTDKNALVHELRELANRLRVQQALNVYNASIDYLGSAKDAKYFVVSLDPETVKITVWRYKALQSEAANAHYTELEGAVPDGASTQVVLVSVDNINALRRAYPNYFLDTNRFNMLVTRVLSGDIPDPKPAADEYAK
jgi:hypothetical protein